MVIAQNGIDSDRNRINIKDKEALGLLEEDLFNVDEHSDISLSIEYSET